MKLFIKITEIEKSKLARIKGGGEQGAGGAPPGPPIDPGDDPGEPCGNPNK